MKTKLLVAKMALAVLCVLSLALAIFGFGGVTAQAQTTGSGTQADPYVVSTKAELQTAIDNSTSATTTYIKFADDIDSSSAAIDVYADDNISIDLNKHTWTLFYLDNNGAIAISNGYVSCEKGAFQASDWNVPDNAYILKNLEVTVTGVDNGTWMEVGSFTADNCYFKVTSSLYYAIATNGGTFTLTNCKLEGGAGAYKYESGTLTLDGTSITSTTTDKIYDGVYSDSWKTSGGDSVVTPPSVITKQRSRPFHKVQ